MQRKIERCLVDNIPERKYVKQSKLRKVGRICFNTAYFLQQVMMCQCQACFTTDNQQTTSSKDENLRHSATLNRESVIYISMA